MAPQEMIDGMNRLAQMLIDGFDHKNPDLCDWAHQWCRVLWLAACQSDGAARYVFQVWLEVRTGGPPYAREFIDRAWQQLHDDGMLDLTCSVKHEQRARALNASLTSLEERNWLPMGGIPS